MKDRACRSELGATGARGDGTGCLPGGSLATAHSGKFGPGAGPEQAGFILSGGSSHGCGERFIAGLRAIQRLKGHRNERSRHFKAGGATPMGVALDLAFDEINAQKEPYRASRLEYFRPSLFLITASPDRTKASWARYVTHQIVEGDDASRYLAG